MPDISRRSLVAGVVGGFGLAGASGYAWDQYRTRNHLRFRPLHGVNESDEPAALFVSVRRDGDVFFEATYDVEPAGDDRGQGRTHLAGPWIKNPAAYSIHARLDDEEHVLEHAEIVDRLGDTGWGSTCARVAIVVTEERRLESRVSPSDVC